MEELRKKRGRPAGYRKQPDGTWVKTSTVTPTDESSPECTQMEDPQKIIEPSVTEVSVPDDTTHKKRGRPSGYRKLQDGTWVKLGEVVSPKKDDVAPKKRGRPAGYRKLSDGTWVKQVDATGSSTPEHATEVTAEFPTDDQVDTIVKSMDRKECPPANVFNFVTVVSDPTLQDGNDLHFVHDIFKVFNAKGIKDFYIDDPYNSLSAEDFEDLYDWMDLEGYLSSTLTKGNKRKFTAVFKNNEPYFILFSALSGSDGEYAATLAGLPITDVSTGKVIKFKTKTGLWGLFPCGHLDAMDKASRDNVPSFKFCPKGFYYENESFPGSSFEVYFDGIVAEIGGKENSFSVALDLKDFATPASKVISSVETAKTDYVDSEEGDEVEQEDAEDYDDSYDAELNFETHKPKKLLNDFILDSDGIFRRRYRDACGDYISSNRSDIFYADTDLEKDHYASLGDGAYRSRNHQLSDCIDFDEMD